MPLALRVAVVVAVLIGTAMFARPGYAVCSVLSHHPCIPHRAFCSVLSGHPCFAPCSVFRRRPCTPDIEFPFGEQLQLTIDSRSREPNAGSVATVPDRKLGTIQDVFSALRACWAPPPAAQARVGMQMSVRLSFKRNGEIFGQPHITYVTADTSAPVRQAYWDAITASLARCSPLPLSAGLGGALAGRPLAIRFVDDRTL